MTRTLDVALHLSCALFSGTILCCIARDILKYISGWYALTETVMHTLSMFYTERYAHKPERPKTHERASNPYSHHPRHGTPASQCCIRRPPDERGVKRDIIQHRDGVWSSLFLRLLLTNDKP